MTQDKGIEALVERLKLLGQENFEMLGNIHEPLFEAATTFISLQEELTSTKDLLDIAKGEARLHAERFALLQEERDRYREALEDIAMAGEDLGDADRSHLLARPYSKRAFHALNEKEPE